MTSFRKKITPPPERAGPAHLVQPAQDTSPSSSSRSATIGMSDMVVTTGFRVWQCKVYLHKGKGGGGRQECNWCLGKVNRAHLTICCPLRFRLIIVNAKLEPQFTWHDTGGWEVERGGGDKEGCAYLQTHEGWKSDNGGGGGQVIFFFFLSPPHIHVVWSLKAFRTTTTVILLFWPQI